MTNGNEVEQQSFDGANTQQWIFTHIGDNVYTIRSTKNNSYYLGIQNDSTADGANIVLRTGTVTNGMKWKVERGDEGYKIVSYSDPTMVLCTNSSNTTTGEKLILSDFEGNNNSYRDEWSIQTGNVYVEFSYDLGFINAHRLGTESVLATRTRIENNIVNDYFPVVAAAFAQQCGVYLMFSSITNYTSDADTCPYSGISVHCDCIDESECLLGYYHNPNHNNSVTGFQHDVHCKSFIRLRNNLISGIPENTIRVTYSGHDLCFYSLSDGHEYNLVGLADYDYPIICINEDQSDTDRCILVLAHELTHLYGIEHHVPIAGQPCIMDEDRYDQNYPDDPTTYWCQNCINTIKANRNKY